MKSIGQLAADAAKVAQPIFAANGWTWHYTDNQVPTVDQMESFIYNLIWMAKNQRKKHLGSGRITVNRINADTADQKFTVSVDVGASYDS